MNITTKLTYKDLPATGLTGLGGSDTVLGDNDLDLLIEATGTAGLDTLELSVNLADLNLNSAKNNSWVATHTAIDDVVLLLKDVERIQGKDKSLALDVKGAAGEVYALLCTAFGKADVTPAMVGSYLFQKDTYTRLGTAKVDELLAKNILDSVAYKQDAMGSSNETFVKQVYKNVLNQAPSFADLMYFTMELDKGTFSQAQLLEAASNLELTRTNIGLVGLETTGIEYIPVGG
jgi:serralysin